MANVETCCTGIIGPLTGLAWPVIVAVAIWYFRTEIGEAIGRLKQIGPSGVGFTAPRQNEVRDLRAPETVRPAATLPPAKTTTINLFEQQTKASLESTPADMREPFLIRHLSEVRLELALERIYRQIFGSQISLLYQMNLSPVSRQRAEQIYAKAAGEYSDFYSTYSFEQWLGFLWSAGLIVDATQQVLAPTPAVPEFLSYMVANHLTHAKPG